MHKGPVALNLNRRDLDAADKLQHRRPNPNNHLKAAARRKAREEFLTKVAVIHRDLQGAY